jgi:monothiol glutaredoxin
MSNTNERIKEIIDAHEVVLFMKGTRMFPQCGFSARCVEVLKRCDVKFKDVNVLADPEKWDAVKTFSNWPTIPQVYIEGEFVGGCDILSDMHTSGDLEKKFEALATKD